MHVYVDSSALLKRVFSEAEPEALISALRAHVAEGSVLVSSALAWVEVSRALRAYPGSLGPVEVGFVADTALSGVLEKPVSGEVIALARRLTPPVLRTLDAIHLASALLIDADVLMTYDQRLIEATTTHGISTSSPGR
jgi:uncharacterized protein